MHLLMFVDDIVMLDLGTKTIVFYPSMFNKPLHCRIARFLFYGSMISF